MEELKKVRRVIAARLPGAPHETLLVLDATTGQNALQQARAVQGDRAAHRPRADQARRHRQGRRRDRDRDELGLPVKLIGVGEALEDLRPFDPQAFARALVEG